PLNFFSNILTLKVRNLLYLLLSSIYLLSGCAMEDCFSTKTGKLKFGFFDIENEEEMSVRVLKVTSPGADSVFIENRQVRVDTLELNPSDSTSLFNFEFVLFQFDTVYVPPDNIEIERIDTIPKDTI